MIRAAHLFAVVVLVWLVEGCSLSRADRVRTALDAFAITAQGASHAAEAVCEERGRSVIARAADPSVPADYARAELADVHARCDQTRSVFDVMRAVHDEAARSVEAGAVEHAEQLLQELRAHWAALGASS